MRDTECLFLVIDLANSAYSSCNFLQIVFNLFSERRMNDETDVVDLLSTNPCDVFNQTVNDWFAGDWKKWFCSGESMRSESFSKTRHRYDDIHLREFNLCFLYNFFSFDKIDDTEPSK